MPSTLRKWPAPTGAPTSSCALPPTASIWFTLTAEYRALTEDMTVIATPRARCGARRRHGRREQRGHRRDHLRASGIRRLERAFALSRTSRNLGLISEASMRYERGVDDHLCEVVSPRRRFWPRCPGHRSAPAWWMCTSFPPPVRAHLPHPALCVHDGGGHSR